MILNVYHLYIMDESLHYKFRIKVRIDTLHFCFMQVAMGIPLHHIKCIRTLYGEQSWANTPIDFKNPQMHPTSRGHVIAARITSENPDEVGQLYC